MQKHMVTWGRLELKDSVISTLLNKEQIVFQLCSKINISWGAKANNIQLEQRSAGCRQRSGSGLGRRSLLQLGSHLLSATVKFLLRTSKSVDEESRYSGPFHLSEHSVNVISKYLTKTIVLFFLSFFFWKTLYMYSILNTNSVLLRLTLFFPFLLHFCLHHYWNCWNIGYIVDLFTVDLTESFHLNILCVCVFVCVHVPKLQWSCGSLEWGELFCGLSILICHVWSIADAYLLLKYSFISFY